MSRGNFINNLPTALLTQVFDYLDHTDYLKAMVVCTRWCEILSDDRYIVWHRLCIEPKVLDEENFYRLKRYRSVLISCSYFTEINQQHQLKQYLCNSEAVEMVEELEIKFNVTIWDYIFGSENELNFPNLHTLLISIPMVFDELAQMRCRIVSPKLKTFYNKVVDNEIYCPYPIDPIFKPLEMLNDQIETIVVDLLERGHFLSTTLEQPFTNLRSLSLTADSGQWFCDADFHSGHKTVFNRLNHLKFHDRNGRLADVYGFIITEAKNLNSLEIRGHMMYFNDFSQINHLKQLKELILMISIERSDDQAGLSLPNLTKLTLLAASLAPLTSVPSLRSLTIANNESYFECVEFYRSDFVKAQFRVVADQLESLKITEVYLDDHFIDHICTLINLKSLKLVKVEAETPGIVRMLNSLQRLQYVRFTDCSLADRVVYCEDYFDCSCARCDEGYKSSYRKPEEPWTGQYAEFYSKLAEEHVGCAIVAEGGRVVNSFLSDLCSFTKRVDYLDIY